MPRTQRTDSSAYSGPFIRDMEAMSKDLAVWAADYIETVIETLMPDQRAWMEVTPTPNEKLMLYLDLRGDVQGWRKWIEMKVMEVRQMLADSGLPEEYMVALRLYDIVEPMAIAYSSANEAHLQRVAEPSERYVPSLDDQEEEEPMLLLPGPGIEDENDAAPSF